MNAYLVTIPETREYVEDVICEDGTGPLGYWKPTGIYVAEKPGQAKLDALTDWTNRPRTGVYEDDFLSLRARLLVKDVELERGCADHVDPLWLRVHEVEDHGGRRCDCPVEDIDAAERPTGMAVSFRVAGSHLRPRRERRLSRTDMQGADRYDADA